MLLSDVWRLSDVCLSLAYIGRNSRTERPRRLNWHRSIAHVTLDSDTPARSRLKGQSQGHQAALLSAAQRVRRLQLSAWERNRRWKVLLRCVCSAAREALGCPRGGEGRGILYLHAHSLFTLNSICQYIDQSYSCLRSECNCSISRSQETRTVP